MRFHYVPSTYRGRKFGKGFCGGAYRGCARICGGALDDNLEDTPGPVAVPVNIPVQPAQIQQNLLDFPNITPEMIERARNIIAIAEATGKAQPITKKEAGIWSGIKNIGSKIWNGAKAVASNPLVQTAASMAAPYLIGAVAPTLASYVPKALDNVGRYAYNKLDPIYHQEAIVNKSAGDNFKEIKDNLAELTTKGVSNAVGAVAAAPAAIANAAISAPANVLGWQANILKKGANAVGNAIKSGWNRWWSGSGYRGGRRARLRKGSPEAKAYMARLRAMRGKKKRSGRGYRAGMLPKGLWGNVGRNPLGWSSVPNFRGSGYRGGMFRGVKMIDLAQILMQEKNKPGNTKIDIDWKDAKGNKRTTTTTKANLERMIEGTNKIRKFYDDKDRQKYLKEHYGKKAWPYKNMTAKRYKKILSSHKNTGVTWNKINKYWNDRTKNGDSDFYKKWFAFNYYNRHDPDNVFSNRYVKGKKDKMNRSIISQTRRIRLKKEGLLNDKILEELVPNRFSEIDTIEYALPFNAGDEMIESLGKISKKNIIKGKRKHQKTLATLKKVMKRRRKRNKPVPNITGPLTDRALKGLDKLRRRRAGEDVPDTDSEDEMSPTLSKAAAASATVDVSTGPPPNDIMPEPTINNTRKKKKRISPDLQIIIDRANAFLYDFRKEIKNPGFEAFAEDPGTQNRMAELKDNLKEIVEMYRNGEDISYLRQNIIELQGELELRLRQYKRDIFI